MHWQGIAIGYVSYLAIVSLARPAFARARLPLFIAAAAAWGAFALYGRARLPPAIEVVIPAAILLGGYWLSGLFFVRPDVRIERTLQSIDDAALTPVLTWYRRSSRLVVEYFELSYLLVYVGVPAGAATLVLGGHADQVGRFWTVVLLAEFACYGMLPWIQTRPPRVLESWRPPALGAEAHRAKAAGGAFQHLNQRIVDRASIHANTIPSGHAAGAFATALAMGSTMPVAGVVFLILAVSIAVATVLGRYHYAVDTVLGAGVAIAAWTLVFGA